MPWSSGYNTRSKQAIIPTTIDASIDKDVFLPADAQDTIQAISWSPVSDHIAAASWDGKTRVYEIASSGSARGVALLNAEGPLMSCHWSKDGSFIAAAGADKKVHLLQASSGQTFSFAAHDAPIRQVRFVDIPSAGPAIIASGSWDKTIRYWDIRNTAQPLGQLLCNERVYAMDTAAQTLVVATASRNFHVVDLKNPTTIARTEPSPSQMHYQLRCLSLSPDAKFWVTGTIDGRTSVNTVAPNGGDNFNYTFRCHRDTDPENPKTTKVWTVNGICHHPTRTSCVATAGSDGKFTFWDISKKTRLAVFPSVGGSITSCAFDRTGKWFAYAVGYDWTMGHIGNKPDYPNGLRLHPVAESELTKEATPRR